MSEDLKRLPVYEHLDEIFQTVLDSRVTILTATPGSGKTVLVAPHILKNTELRIAMLQPRRVAAQLSAQSIAKFNNWTLGEEVGLVMKDVNKRSSNTRLTIMTEGVLSRMLASGDADKNFDLIILDEFHERSVHTDLACAWAKRQNRVKLLVMSATLNSGPLVNFFPEAKAIHIEGRVFPIESHYLKQNLNFHDRSQFNTKLVEVCDYALQSHKEGNILVFLPGRSEIQMAREALNAAKVETIHNLEIHSLYSQAKKEEQKRALADDSKRKVILSTNIAETSLTLPDIQVVIDSGLKRESDFNAKTGVQSLAVRRIALDSATQRAGRAGRLKAGACYKMWTIADEQRMRSSTPAEIHRTDPIEFIIRAMSFGSSPENFEFLEAPSTDQWTLAMDRLEISGCVQEQKLTELGRWVSQFPGDFSCGLLTAASLGKKHLNLALLTIAILQEGDPAPFLSSTHQGQPIDELRSRLEWLKENHDHRYHQLAKRLKQQADKISQQKPATPDFENLEETLCFAFPHRLCRFRNDKKNNAIMTTGRGVSLGKRKSGKATEFFIALNLIDHRVHRQAESEVSFRFDVSKKTIKKVFEKSIKQISKVENAGKKGEPKAYQYQALWQMPLEDPRGLPLEKSHMIEHLKKALIEDHKLALIDFTESLSFVERALFCQKQNPEMNLPTFSHEDWLLIVDAAYSETSEIYLEDKGWLKAIKMLFTEAQLDFIDSFAPLTMATKARKHNKIDYSDSSKPMISIILQEAFEFKESPCIGHGSVPIAIELLAPSRRPIEVSQDMARFWQSSYPEVRKQYRGRYPKHSWPEDPFQD